MEYNCTFSCMNLIYNLGFICLADDRQCALHSVGYNIGCATWLDGDGNFEI